MRWMACISFVLVAACGSGDGGSAEQNKAEEAPASIPAGQWELTSEVTSLAPVGPGTPKVNTPPGTRATETVCVGAGQPTAKLFSGADYDCRYENFYVRHGRANVGMVCTRHGLDGNVLMTAVGTFGADSLDYTRDLNSTLAGDGDFRMGLHVTGRRTGACAPESAEGNSSAASRSR